MHHLKFTVKNCLSILFLVFSANILFAEEDGFLPKYPTEAELLMMQQAQQRQIDPVMPMSGPNSCVGNCGGQAPGGCYCDEACQNWGDCCPDFQSTCFPPSAIPSDVVFPGEFEEVQAVAIRWPGTNPSQARKRLFVEMADAIQQEAEVWIYVNQVSHQNIVHNHMAEFGKSLTNYQFFVKETNSIWIRDYGPWGFYYGPHDSLGFVDIQYYNSRPLDNSVPLDIANRMNKPIFKTALYNEGGNLMVDGFGYLYHSTASYNRNPNTTQQMVRNVHAGLFKLHDQTVVQRLQCDGGTGHIDMYAKLLSRHSMIVTQYPSVVTAADRQIIENNVQVFESQTTTYGTPMEVHRIGMPRQNNGTYATTCTAINSDARGFVNGLFVNGTYLMPAYSSTASGHVAGDSAAVQRYRDLLPGYRIVPIDARSLTTSGGAIHCVAMQIPADNPIRFWHPPITGLQPAKPDYHILSRITNRSGIQSANCYWRVRGEQNWNALPLADSSGYFVGHIINESFTVQDTIEYYLHATSNNGKQMTKPIVAPEGYFSFYFNENFVVNLEVVQASPMQLCPGNQFSVDFSITGTTGSTSQQTTLELELSDFNGDFQNAILIGTSNATASGTITATIPSNQDSGANYKLRIKNDGHAVSSPASSFNLIINEIPQASSISALSSTSICAGDDVVLQITQQTGVSYQWYVNGQTTGTNHYAFTATTSGNYSLEISNNCGLVSANNTIAVDVSEEPDSPSISAGSATQFCTGDLIQIELSVPLVSGVNYQWKKDNVDVGTNNPLFIATEAGEYRVIVSNNCGNSSSDNVIEVAVQELPMVASILATGSTTICAGDYVLLETVEQSEVSYQWLYDGQAISGANNYQFAAENEGVYSLQISNACDTISADNSIQLTVNESPEEPVILADGQTQICQGADVQLSVAPQSGVGYQWKKDNVDVGVNSPYFLATESGDYTLLVTDVCGSALSQNVVEVDVIEVLPAVSINANSSTAVCQGDTVLLQTTQLFDVDYQWFLNGQSVVGNTNELVVDTEGIYTLEITNICETVTASNEIEITIEEVPESPFISASGTTTICQGDEVELSVPVVSGLHYQWKRNNIEVGGNSPVYIASAEGDYTVIVTATCGSVVSQNVVTVSVSQSPLIPSISASGYTTFCDGGEVTLSVPQNVDWSYQWQMNGSPSGMDSPLYEATESGIYTVIVTNFCGIVSSMNSVNVQVFDLPEVNLSGIEAVYCDTDEAVNLTTSHSGGYLTYDVGLSVSGNTVYPDQSLSGNYTISYTYTDNNGCSNSDSLYVEIVESPESPVIQLSGDTLFAGNTNASVYQWYLDGVAVPGANESFIIPLVEGYYIVEVSNADCNNFSDEYLFRFTRIGDVFSTENIKVYPNPAGEYFIIEIKSDINQKYEIRLLNLLGQIVYETDFNTEQFMQYRVNSETLSPGVYYLQLNNGNDAIFEKVVIK